jgi:hypothetical protein
MTNGRFVLALLLAASMAGARDARAEDPAPGIKSESRALAYSLGGTALPIGSAIVLGGQGGAAFVVLGGAVIGPSLGHFYADRPGRAMIGIGIRTAALAGLVVAIGSSWENENSDASALAVGSLIVGTASMLADIADAPHSARVHNGKRTEHRFSIEPWGSRRAAGIRATVVF